MGGGRCRKGPERQRHRGSFTLDDGTQIYLAEGIPAESIKEGSKVKVTFEERDGKKVATTVEMAE